MTTTEKQKCIAEQGIYGNLLVQNKITSLIDTLLGSAHNSNSLLYFGGNIHHIDPNYLLPILRPLSDLTKEITHKGYNDDQPFIPLMEVAKMLNPKLHWSLETDTIGAYAYARENAFPHYVRPSQLACCSIDLFDLLHQWHFDTRNLIDAGDAVDVNTLETNPYEV